MSVEATNRTTGPATGVISGGLVLLRRLPIDFRRVAEECGLVRGKLCHSPHFGWGVQNSYGDPGPDFGCITPPALAPGETELRIDCSEWWFMGPRRADETKQENNFDQPTPVENQKTQ